MKIEVYRDEQEVRNENDELFPIRYEIQVWRAPTEGYLTLFSEKRDPRWESWGWTKDLQAAEAKYREAKNIYAKVRVIQQAREVVIGG